MKDENFLQITYTYQKGCPKHEQDLKLVQDTVHSLGLGLKEGFSLAGVDARLSISVYDIETDVMEGFFTEEDLHNFLVGSLGFTLFKKLIEGR